MIHAEFVDFDMIEIPYKIREKVFIQGQNIAVDVERDIYDKEADHVVVYEENIAVATGRLIYKDGEYLIGRIGVLPEYRGKRYGDLVVRMLVDKAFRKGAFDVFVHAQLSAVDFYKKIGFKRFGDVYIESGIEHISMSISPITFAKPCDDE